MGQLREKRKAIVNAAPKQRKSARGALAAKVFPKRCPDWARPDFDDHEIAAFLPEGFRCYKDTYNYRWQLSWDSGRSRRGRSWQLYGPGLAAKMLVSHAWFIWLERHGGECPIAGLEPCELVG